MEFIGEGVCYASYNLSTSGPEIYLDPQALSFSVTMAFRSPESRSDFDGSQTL